MAVGSRLANGDGDTTGECLEIDAGGTSTTTVVMRTCHTNAHQSWYFTAHTGGVIAIRSHDPDAAGRCLTAGVFQDLPVRMAACPTVGAPQAWHIVGDPDGWFQLRNHAYSDQCLDVSANGLGDVVKTWGCRTTSNGNQLWKWRSVG
jgi:hypothetical protein|nr:hypothetical protein [uncultured bacterium]AXL06575.1 hypothetical protein [uncultured bacterium]